MNFTVFNIGYLLSTTKIQVKNVVQTGKMTLIHDNMCVEPKENVGGASGEVFQPLKLS